MSNIMSEGEDKLDIETGYFTRESFTKDSDSYEKYEETVTDLVRSTRKFEKNRYWYLTTMALPGGVLFPAGTPEKYDWLVAPVVPFETTNSTYKDTQETRVAVEDAKKFDKFQEALVYLGML